MSDYTVIWDGRASLHEVFLSPRDLLLWQQRGSALTDAAPGSTDMLSYREAFPSYQHYQALPKKLKAKRAAARAKGNCSKCCRRPARRGRQTCVRCAEQQGA